MPKEKDNRALDIHSAFYTLVLMLLTKFVPNSTIRTCSVDLRLLIMILNLHQIFRFVLTFVYECNNFISQKFKKV